ncbi:MAG: dehydrogenase, partial [Frankiales bacterium]|nr:dehydrogenase [Frankiales bacterium]
AEAAALEEFDSSLLVPGSVVLVGERLASAPGALSAAAALAGRAGAKLAWIPRRAGERGAIDVGAVPTMLPGGRSLAQASELGWGDVPPEAGKDLNEILAAVKAKQLKGLVLGAFDPTDAPDPTLALDAIEAAEFVVSLEIRRSPVTDRADVVFPVAAAVEKGGTFLDWEGRARPFDAVLSTSGALTDARVLDALAQAMDRPLGLPDLQAARAEIFRLGATSAHPAPPTAHLASSADAPEPSADVTTQDGDPEAASSADAPEPSADETTQEAVVPGAATLATWHLLLDDGSLQDGEPHLAGTARSPRLHLSAATAAGLQARDGDSVTVSTDRGSVTLPLVVADLPDDVVWVPTRTRGAHVRTDLSAAHGDAVVLSKGSPQ